MGLWHVCQFTYGICEAHYDIQDDCLAAIIVLGREGDSTGGDLSPVGAGFAVEMKVGSIVLFDSRCVVHKNIR